MTFVVAQRFSDAMRMRGRSVLRAGRLLANRLHIAPTLTPQERANLYLSRMPLAVVSASLGAHPSDAAMGRR